MNVSISSRRRLLQGGATLAGSFVIGLQGEKALGAIPESGALSDVFLAILPDGTITLQMFQAEMGQSIYTVLAKAVAEELDVDLSAVHMVFAPVNPIYRNRFLGTQGTAVCSTIRVFGALLRTAAAQARAMPVAAAAKGWSTAPEALVTEGGRVRDPASGRSAAYGDLVTDAAGCRLHEHAFAWP